MFEEINKKHCDVFTIDEFEYLRKYQIIMKHDGDGYWQQVQNLVIFMIASRKNQTGQLALFGLTNKGKKFYYG